MKEDIKKEVICINTNTFLDITKGVTYTVIKEHENQYTIIDDDRCRFRYDKKMFKELKGQDYKCTDCGHINKKINNNKIMVGYCDNCEHPLWNQNK